MDRVTALFRELCHQDDLPTAISTLLRATASLISADRCTLFLVDRTVPDAPFLTPAVSQGVLRDSVRHRKMATIRIPVDGASVAGYCAKTAEAVLIADAYSDSRFDRRVDESTGYKTKTILAVPLKEPRGGQVHAVLQAVNKISSSSSSPPSFDEQDKAIMSLLADYCGTLLHQLTAQALAERERVRSEQMLSLVRQITMASTTMTRLADVVDTVIESCYRLLNVQRVTLFLLDDARKHLVISSSADAELCGTTGNGGGSGGGGGLSVNSSGVRVPLSSGLAGYCARHGVPVCVADAYQSPLFSPAIDKATGFKTRSVLCVPILSSSAVEGGDEQQQEVVGVLQVINRMSNGASPFYYPNPSSSSSSLSSASASASTALVGVVGGGSEAGSASSPRPISSGAGASAALTSLISDAEAPATSAAGGSSPSASPSPASKNHRRAGDKPSLSVSAGEAQAGSDEEDGENEGEEANDDSELDSEAASSPDRDAEQRAKAAGLFTPKPVPALGMFYGAFPPPAPSPAAIAALAEQGTSPVPSPSSAAAADPTPVAIAPASVLDDPNVWPFTPQDVALLEGMAAHTAVALRNAQMLETLRRNQKTTAALLDIVQSSATDDNKKPMSVLVDQIVQAAYTLLDCERVTLFLVDAVKQELWIALAKDSDHTTGARIPIGHGLAGYVAATGQPLNIADAYKDSRHDPSFDALTGYRTKSVLVWPIAITDPSATARMLRMRAAGSSGPASAALSSSSASKDDVPSSSVIAVLQAINKRQPSLSRVASSSLLRNPQLGPAASVAAAFSSSGGRVSISSVGGYGSGSGSAGGGLSGRRTGRFSVSSMASTDGSDAAPDTALTTSQAASGLRAIVPSAAGTSKKFAKRGVNALERADNATNNKGYTIARFDADDEKAMGAFCAEVAVALKRRSVEAAFLKVLADAAQAQQHLGTGSGGAPSSPGGKLSSSDQLLASAAPPSPFMPDEFNVSLLALYTDAGTSARLHTSVQVRRMSVERSILTSAAGALGLGSGSGGGADSGSSRDRVGSLGFAADDTAGDEAAASASSASSSSAAGANGSGNKTGGGEGSGQENSSSSSAAGFGFGGAKALAAAEAEAEKELAAEEEAVKEEELAAAAVKPRSGGSGHGPRASFVAKGLEPAAIPAASANAAGAGGATAGASPAAASSSAIVVVAPPSSSGFGKALSPEDPMLTWNWDVFALPLTSMPSVVLDPVLHAPELHTLSTKGVLGDPTSDQAFLVYPSSLTSHNDAAAVAKGEQRLTGAVFSMFKQFALLKRFGIEEGKFLAFINAVRRKYHPNPFHNYYHGVSVLHAAFLLLGTTNATEMLTFRDILATLLAAYGHDLDHPGHGNAFEVNSLSPLALEHNDDAVLERHHAHTMSTILFDPKSAILSSMSAADVRATRTMIVKAILGTDMAKHFTGITHLGERFSRYTEAVRARTAARSAAAAVGAAAAARAANVVQSGSEGSAAPSTPNTGSGSSSSLASPVPPLKRRDTGLPSSLTSKGGSSGSASRQSSSSSSSNKGSLPAKSLGSLNEDGEGEEEDEEEDEEARNELEGSFVEEEGEGEEEEEESEEEEAEVESSRSSATASSGSSSGAAAKDSPSAGSNSNSGRGKRMSANPLKRSHSEGEGVGGPAHHSASTRELDIRRAARQNHEKMGGGSRTKSGKNLTSTASGPSSSPSSSSSPAAGSSRPPTQSGAPSASASASGGKEGLLSMVAEASDPDLPLPFDRDSLDDRTELVMTIVHTADLSGQAYPSAVSRNWNARILAEFRSQAAKERSMGLPVAPFMANLDTAMACSKLQQSFVANIVIPLWQRVSDLLPGLGEPLYNLNASRLMFEAEIIRLERERTASINSTNANGGGANSRSSSPPTTAAPPAASRPPLTAVAALPAAPAPAVPPPPPLAAPLVPPRFVPSAIFNRSPSIEADALAESAAEAEEEGEVESK